MAAGVVIPDPSTLGQQAPAAQEAKPGKRDFSHLGVSDQDRRDLLECVRLYRDSWMTNRLELFRIWSRNSLFRKGIQVLGWDPGTGNWFDALAYYRESGAAAPGEDTDLEPFITNVTLTCCNAWTGILAVGVPTTVVEPSDSRVPKDVRAAKSAKVALETIHRQNGADDEQLEAYENQFDFGCFFRHVRAVFDGDLFGWDQQAYFEDLQVKPPARMKCKNCAAETPLSDLAAAPGGGMPECPGCGEALGQDSYYAEGEGGYMSLQMAGTREVPRAGVKETVHDPREIDMDPKARRVRQTPVLASEHEIDVGEARMMFPDLCDSIQEGMTSPTSANAEYERFRRLEGYAAAGNQTSDLNQSSVTYSEVWMQPQSFYRKGDKAFGDRMKKAFPRGLMIANLGEETTEIRKACLSKEWTHCGVQRGFGAYPPAIAERVVPFNRRINSANQTLDEYAQTGSLGLNFGRASMLDTKKITGQKLAPQTIIPLPDKINGEPRPMAEIFAHFDTPIMAQMWTYAQQLYTFLMLVAELPPQVSGGGTQPGVDTGMGQAQMLDRALTIFRRYWTGGKRERSEADENCIYWLKELMKVGAVGELWDVEQDQGGSFKNKAVNPADLDGNCRFRLDPALDLPVTPEELRDAIAKIYDSLNNQNPAGAEWFDDPDNQEMAISALVPGSRSPSEAQRLKTLGDLARLAELTAEPPEPQMAADGKPGFPQLPVMPSLSDDLVRSESIAAEYLRDNADKQWDGTPTWKWWQLYYDAIGEMQALKQAKQAQRQQKVQQAGAPPQQPMDPTVEGEMKQLLQVSGPAIQRLLQLASLDPMATKGTATAQVSAAKEIVDTTVDAAKLATGGK
jgi:hypothetical protein